MARSNLFDIMQTHCFWLFDAFPIEPGGLPVLNPLAGYSAITSPELQVEFQEIQEGNWEYPRKVIKHARHSTITLQRGVTFIDSDFWRWITTAIRGDPGHFRTLIPGLSVGGSTPRRNLVLVHFLARLPIPAGVEAAARTAGRALADGTQQALGSVLGPGVADVIQAGAGLQATYFAPFEVVGRLPGRAFILGNALPGRYKTGGDFDASSGAVSIAELDIEIESMEQINMGP